MLAWMAWTWQTALFFCLIALALIILTLLAIYRPETPRDGILAVSDDAGRPVLRHADRLGVHLHLLDAARRGRALVPARRIGGLRRRDVPFRVTVSCLPRVVRGGYLGRKQNGRETS